jgi:hypothetical protein
MPHLLDRLRRLRRNADARMFADREDVGIVEYDVERIEIAGQAAHFHVIALAHDDDVIAITREGRHRPVRDADEGTRRFHDRKPERAGTRKCAFGRPMGGNHHRRRPDVLHVPRDGDAFGVQGAKDRGVVDEVAENRQRTGICAIEGKIDGVANAETHAKVKGAENTHNFIVQSITYTLQCKADRVTAPATG